MSLLLWAPIGALTHWCMHTGGRQGNLGYALVARCSAELIASKQSQASLWRSLEPAGAALNDSAQG